MSGFDPFANSQLEIGGVYFLARLAQAPKIILPPERRLPFRWKAFGLLPDGKSPDVLLTWTANVEATLPARLRLTTAWECREPVKVEVLAGVQDRKFGTIDILANGICGLYELRLNPTDAQIALAEGIRLRMIQGNEPIWFFHDENPPDDGRAALMPLLIFEHHTFPLAEFYNRMGSLASIQPFGLREGCVLDGIWSLRQAFGAASYRPAIETHLRIFFDSMGRLIYEKPFNIPSDGVLWSVRGILPFATLARVWPNHPAIDFVINFLRSRMNARGSIQDEAMTIEDCYTVAYPLAVIGRLRRNNFLIEQALKQITLRKQCLVQGDTIYQRMEADGQCQMPHWTRSVGWYLQGLTKTLLEIGPSVPTQWKEEVQRVAQWCLARQGPTGAWPAFMEQPVTSDVETFGSAIIASALAQGVAGGLLPPTMLKPARRAVSAMLKFITPDGYLAGATPLHTGADDMQRGPHRVISQAAMGMLAQAIAIVGKK